MTLRRYIAIVMALLATIALLAIVAMTFVTGSLRRSAAAIGQATESIYAAVELRSLLVHQSRDWVGRSAAPSTSWDEDLEQRSHWIAEIRRHVGSQNEHRLVEYAIDLVEKAVPVGASTDDQSAVRTDDTTLGVRLRAAREALTRVVDINVEQARALEQAVLATENQAELAGALLLLTLVVLLGVIAFTTLRNLYHPLVALRAAIDRYRQDGVAVKLSESTIAELAEIEEAFADMRTTIETQRQMQLRFVAGVAHDIRNPLTTLQVALPVLGDEQFDGAARAELQHVAMEQLAYLAHMVTDLMDTASIESGQLSLRTEPHDVNALVAEVCALHSASAPRHRIERRLPADPAMAHVDRARLSQVLNNLLSNAIKYSPNGGTVSVDVLSDSTISIAIRDQGIGIAEDDARRIFEPFARTAEARRAFGGLGLGLSVSLKIIRAHGGDITVTSTPGVGSTFVVTLPEGR